MIPEIQAKSLKEYLINAQIYLSLIIIGIAIIGIIIIPTHIFKKYSQYNLQLISESLASEVQAAVVFDDKTTLNETLDTFIQKYPLTSITIRNTHGDILSTISSNQNLPNLPLLENFQHWLIPSEFGYTDVTHNGQKIAHVQITTSIKPLLDFLQLFALVVFFCGLSAYLITRFSTKIIYQKINSSLSLLTNTTDNVIKNRNFEQKIPTGHIYEFNQISNSFNELLKEVHVWHTHLEQKNSHLEHRVLHDTLTQLPNRAFFYQRLNQLFENHVTRESFALLYIDNNDFKLINDSYGHQIGDIVLQEMAQRLKLNLRSNDFIARIGGDEFAVLLQNITQPSHAIVVAQNLIRASHGTIAINASEHIEISFSIGIALSNSVTSTEQLIYHADLAMYKAKLDQHRHYAVYE